MWPFETRARTVPWEQGSEFHWLLPPHWSSESAIPPGAVLFSSGRTALLALLDMGVGYGWKRLWLPTYYCKEVIATVWTSQLEAVFYPDSPFGVAPQPPRIINGDVVLVANVFGLRTQADYTAFYSLGVPVIEDHTHDPWSDWAVQSRADYGFASYRKTLPIPDGGAVWSNMQRPLPAELEGNGSCYTAASTKLQGMLLKALYFQTGNVEKNVFLSLYHAGEEAFHQLATRAISPVSKQVLATFPWRFWREQRAKNYAVLQELLRDCPYRVITKSIDVCPFSFILFFPTRQIRDGIRAKLIARSVYPAVLWPLEASDCAWAGEEAVNAAGRLLSIHCDGRYSTTDMEITAKLVYRAITDLT